MLYISVRFTTKEYLSSLEIKPLISLGQYYFMVELSEKAVFGN